MITVKDIISLIPRSKYCDNDEDAYMFMFIDSDTDGDFVKAALWRDFADREVVELNVNIYEAIDIKIRGKLYESDI